MGRKNAKRTNKINEQVLILKMDGMSEQIRYIGKYGNGTFEDPACSLGEDPAGYGCPHCQPHQAAKTKSAVLHLPKRKPGEGMVGCDKADYSIVKAAEAE